MHRNHYLTSLADLRSVARVTFYKPKADRAGRALLVLTAACAVLAMAQHLGAF